MTKKIFTLIEMWIVIIIILIILLMLSFIGKEYIQRMQFKNDKEKLTNFYLKAFSQSISSNYYDGIKYNQIRLISQDKKKDIGIYYKTNNSLKEIRTDRFENSFFSGFFYSGSYYNTGQIVYDSYQLGCKFYANNTYYTGNDFKFKLFFKNEKFKYCFKIPLLTCKFQEYQCEN